MVVKKILGSLSTILLIGEITVETRQFAGLPDKKDYLLNAWNWLDIIGLSLTLIFNIHTLLE